MQKDTSEIVKELQLSPSFQSFYQENKDYMVDKTLAQLLEQMLYQQGKSHQERRNERGLRISYFLGKPHPGTWQGLGFGNRHGAILGANAAALEIC